MYNNAEVVYEVVTGGGFSLPVGTLVRAVRPAACGMVCVKALKGGAAGIIPVSSVRPYVKPR